MIKGFFVINNHGKARLIKDYQRMTQADQQQTVREIFGLLSKRSDNVCNFLEGGSVSKYSKDTKLIYRHFATLYFVVAADGSESELGLLDLVHVFVEALDERFENVCELDLIFHSDSVHYILDEIIMGGMVLETNRAEVTEAVRAMDKLETDTRGAAVKA